MSKPNINVNVQGPQEPSTTPMNLIELTEAVTELQESVDRHGDERPTGLTSADAGFMFFDTTLRMPIWWNGEGWVKADGADAPTE